MGGGLKTDRAPSRSCFILLKYHEKTGRYHEKNGRYHYPTFYRQGNWGSKGFKKLLKATKLWGSEAEIFTLGYAISKLMLCIRTYTLIYKFYSVN